MIPPRPNMIPEQLRDRMAQLTGGTMRFNRTQTAQLLVMLAVQLDRMLNDDQRLPLARSDIDKRPVAELQATLESAIEATCTELKVEGPRGYVEALAQAAAAALRMRQGEGFTLTADLLPLDNHTDVEL